VVFSSLLVFLTGCKHNPAAPETQPSYGMAGKIYSANGTVITGAKVYCLYFLNDFPVDPPTQVTLGKQSETNDYPFELYESFPDPCAHSFFVRFSLPVQCSTDLSIISKRTGNVVYHQSESLIYGFYQRYFGGIVDSLGLTNGIYQCQLTAKGSSDTTYEGKNTFLVVSDGGTPNAVSSPNGDYFFDSRDAFIGDSVAVSPDGTVGLHEYIKSPVNLIVIKNGFKSKLVSIEVVSNIVLTVDIVLDPLP
jgi:hypothetical protein